MKLAIAICLIAACKAKPEEAKEVAGPAPIVSRGPQSADAIVDRAFDLAAPPFVVASFAFQYLRADGMLDPTYGAAQVAFGYHFADPEDDPKRPIGAPVVAAVDPTPPVFCPIIDVKTDTMTTGQIGGCAPLDGLPHPTCKLTQVWQRAIEDGAPANALAGVELAGPSWTIRIDDAPRNLHWTHVYRDAECAHLVPKPLPAEALPVDDVQLDVAPKPTCDEVSCVIDGYAGACCARFRKVPSGKPAEITRDDITKAIAKLKPTLMACGDKSTAHGVVRMSVKVSPAGTVASVMIKDTPDPNLGKCVALAAKKLGFPATDAGGSFSVPFTF